MNHFIYFDQEDKNRDGFGWNLVDDHEGAIAVRYEYFFDALAYCYKYRLNWQLVGGIPSPAEATN